MVRISIQSTMFQRFKGAVRISPGFILLLFWFAAGNGWGLLGTILLAAAVHEAGHCLMLRLCGGECTGLRIGVLGAVLETGSARLPYGQELLVVLAGPVPTACWPQECGRLIWGVPGQWERIW